MATKELKINTTLHLFAEIKEQARILLKQEGRGLSDYVNEALRKYVETQGNKKTTGQLLVEDLRKNHVGKPRKERSYKSNREMYDALSKY